MIVTLGSLCFVILRYLFVFANSYLLLTSSKIFILWLYLILSLSSNNRSFIYVIPDYFPSIFYYSSISIFSSFL